MYLDVIEVSGARVHNLKNIDINIPKNKLVITLSAAAVNRLWHLTHLCRRTAVYGNSKTCKGNL